MRYSIFLLLGLIYTLVAVIAFFVVRMMRREARLAAANSSGVSVEPPADPKPSL
jgi:hypothetical protein